MKYAIIALVVIAALSGIIYKLTEYGRQIERAAQFEKAKQNVTEREKINGKLKNSTAADLCSKLGGVYNETTGECD